MKARIAVTAALTITLIGGGTSAAFADDTAPVEVAPSASTSEPSAPSEPTPTETPSNPTPTSTPGSNDVSPTTPPDTPVESPAPTSEPVAPEPVTITVPTPDPPLHPKPPTTTQPVPDKAPEPVATYVTVLWQMPGAETTWPQKYIDQVDGSDVNVWSPDDLACGTSYQVDVYPTNAVPALTADGILEQGEDTKVVLDYTTFTTDACVSVTPLTPTVKVHCAPSGGGYQSVILPEQEGVIYQVTEPGMNAIVVQAVAREGFVLTGTTSWEFSKVVTDENVVCPPPASSPPPKATNPPTHVTIHTAVDRVTTPAVAAPVAGSLAFTGSNADRWLEWGALILAVGLGLFALGRRRREEDAE